MKCRHCLTAFKTEIAQYPLGGDAESSWAILKTLCPQCGRFNLKLVDCVLAIAGSRQVVASINREYFIHPKAAARPSPPPEVPGDIAEDYREACLVLPDSPKASAALSRRCLQHVLHTHSFKAKNLDQEIQQVIDGGKLSQALADSLDAVRVMGNFAAHPIKSTSTGEIVPVEPGEAEWTLDVIEALFDHFYVQPAALKRKRDALDAKLKDAGKPVLKAGTPAAPAK